jgi:chromosome segregation ATPase
MEQGQTASSRIEALLQRVLEKVDGLERQIASQNSRLEDVQSELRAVDAKVEGVRGEVVAVKDRQDAADASLKDVVKFAGEERARRIKQEWQQIKFVSVIHVVASVGFVKEVLVCFSLNRSTWIDVRLWRVVINNVYKHTRINNFRTR